MADETGKNGNETPAGNDAGKSAGDDKAKGRGSTTSSGGSSAKSSTGGSSKAASKTDAVELLKQDHRKVEGLFDQFEKARNAAEKKRLVAEIISEFLTHSLLEERIFYPACRERIDDDELDEAQVEHDGAKQLISELRGASPDEPYYDAKVTVLGEYIRHHVAEEERPKDGILAAAVAAGVDTKTLGEEIEASREEFRQQVERRPPDMPSVGRTYKEQIMPQREYGRSSSRYADDDDRRGSNARYQERDEYGRFVSEDDRGRSSRGGSSRGNERGHDEEGRFTSRGDDGRSSGYRSSGGGGRYRDDDDGRGRGHGGWFGDSEGHSEASRRGWDEREGRGRSRDDDDRRYSSSSRGGGGSRYRDDDDGRDRGHGGWFGDSEGHSEAARRGWDEREGRGRGRDDDDRYASQSRSGSRYRDDDDDDDRRSRGGHGGWFGDSRGHSEAARRGWDNR